jgi:hypothetical protein
MNMKFTACAVLGTLSLAAFAPQASAADNGIYIGGGITQTEFDTDNFGTGKLDDNSFKVIVGIRPLDWLAIEANYIDLGSASDSSASLDATALTGSVLFLKEFAVIDVYARAGLAHWKLDASVVDLGSTSESGDEFTYGVGIGAHFGSLGVRAEYEKFQINEIDSDVNTLSLSFTYTFL